MEHPEDIVSYIKNLDGPADGQSVNALLKAIFRGFRMNSIEEIFNSNNYYAIIEGSWLVSELGEKASNLNDVLEKMLGFDHYYIKYCFIDSCITSRRKSECMIIKSIWRFLDDLDIRVRTRAIEWVASADRDALRALWEYGCKEMAREEHFSYEEIDMTYVVNHPLIGDRRFRAVLIGISMRKRFFEKWIDMKIEHEDSALIEILKKTGVKISN
ncbi:hypothetical protein [Marinimicrococcus flavescens]